MHTKKFVVLLIYLASILLHVMFTQSKDTHSFRQMIRYGRAGKNDNSGSINVRPHGEVFYLGPRYGKRSKLDSTVQEDNKDVLYMCSNDKNFSCSYSGITNLYRCNSLRGSILKDNSI
ncbi:RYamide neuropeptides-like isoform X2 [Rhynchophorus ferrugineus]|uniref:RYamide neuropeptides-like isoform X2 n=1 Tax=Rhynchophorus ferrugineus TaxID=354439 RepID=UPI003FCCE6CA